MKKIVSALSMAMLSTAAVGDTNPLQFSPPPACMLDASGALSLQTLAMPKGWFTGNRNTFDRTKTELRVTGTFETTSCVNAVEQTFTSAMLGSFTQGYLPVLNPTSKYIGYVWTMLGDLSAAQNHWNYFTGCDGHKVVVGCPEARGTTFTIAAFDPSGQCRAYTDASGTVKCAGDTIVLQLAAVQDPDFVVPAADCVTVDACGIGECVSARTSEGGTCDQTFPPLLVPKERGNGTYDANADARRQCKNEASCFCKQQLPATCNKTCE